jgi:mediator of RNA polymerase II transcription subunit 5
MVNIATQPSVLSCLLTQVAPSDFLSLLNNKLLEIPEDSDSKGDDPQASLTKFGEGVILVESYASYFKVPPENLATDDRSLHSAPSAGPAGCV